ncbi:rCG28216, partial [Rattus norvegicus]
MEAEEPEHGACTPVPDIEELGAIPEGIMRSSQIPALDPEAQEGQDPSYKWTDGHRSLMDQSKVLRDVSDHTPNSVAIFFKKDSSAMATSQEILLAEARDTADQQEAVTQSLQDRLSTTVAAPELLGCAVQEEWLDIPSKLDSRVEAELQPELMSLTLAVSKEKEEEESSPDTSTPGFWPPSKIHPGETDQ